MTSEYRDKLSHLYESKKVRHLEILERKEKHLKEFEENKKDKEFNKLADSSDEDDADNQPIDKDELWQKFTHKHAEKPVMKVNIEQKKAPEEERI
mmetsp:Transcript_25013/g.27705  ORF Transcript_25013/g.27705 Transcript_25013/m.27705 type:complete len:95 (-) Transcript_25013:8-292(-)